jgi:acyl-CoA thioesterase-1
MNHSLRLLLVILATVGCSASDSAGGNDRAAMPARPAAAALAASESTMVVPTETRVPSADGPVVVFLGTSLTAGMGLERDADSYVSVLAAMGDSAGTPFQAVNAGVSGDTSAGGLRRVDWLLRNRVDILVVELGANDGLRGQDTSRLAENLEEIIRRTRAAYPDAYFIVAGMEAPPNMGDRYTADFRAVFPDVARSTGAELIPFLLDGVAGVPELNQDDRIHPNPEGHRRVALNAWPALRSALAEVAQGAEGR